MPPLQKSLTLPELHRRRYATANHLPDGHECTEQGDGEPFRLSGLFVLCLDFLDRDTGNMTDEAAERRTPVVHPAFGQQVMGLVVALCRQVLKEGRTTFVTQRKVTVGELAPVDHRRHACAVLTVTKTDMGIVDVLLGRQLKRACLAHLSLQLAVLGVSSPMLVTHGHGRIVLRLEELLLEVDSHDKLHKAIVGKEGVVAALGQGHARRRGEERAEGHVGYQILQAIRHAVVRALEETTQRLQRRHFVMVCLLEPHRLQRHLAAFRLRSLPPCLAQQQGLASLDVFHLIILPRMLRRAKEELSAK